MIKHLLTGAELLLISSRITSAVYGLQITPPYEEMNKFQLTQGLIKVKHHTLFWFDGILFFSIVRSIFENSVLEPSILCSFA